MLPRVIECEISIGENSGKKVFIPRIPLITIDIKLPYDLKRIQFPLRHASAMTINKSQGQSLKMVRIWQILKLCHVVNLVSNFVTDYAGSLIFMKQKKVFSL